LLVLSVAGRQGDTVFDRPSTPLPALESAHERIDMRIVSRNTIIAMLLFLFNYAILTLQGSQSSVFALLILTWLRDRNAFCNRVMLLTVGLRPYVNTFVIA